MITRRISNTLMVVLASLVLASCRSGGEVSEVRAPLPSDDPTVDVPEVFRRSLGFDPPSQSPSFEFGQRLLYRVRLHEGESLRQWYVEISVAPPEDGLQIVKTMTWSYTIDGKEEAITSPLVPAFATVIEHGSNRSQASPTQLPQRFLEQGLYDVSLVCHGRAAADYVPTLSVDQKRQYALGCISLVAFLQLVQTNDSLSKVLWTVIKKPSVFTLLFGKVSIGIEPAFDRAVLESPGLPDPLAEWQAFRLPIELKINDSLALEAELLACPPRPPLHMAAGLIRLEGAHPDHPERRVVIELVGAHGPEAER